MILHNRGDQWGDFVFSLWGYVVKSRFWNLDFWLSWLGEGRRLIHLKCSEEGLGKLLNSLQHTGQPLSQQWAFRPRISIVLRLRNLPLENQTPVMRSVLTTSLLFETILQIYIFRDKELGIVKMSTQMAKRKFRKAELSIERHYPNNNNIWRNTKSKK